LHYFKPQDNVNSQLYLSGTDFSLLYLLTFTGRKTNNNWLLALCGHW